MRKEVKREVIKANSILQITPIQRKELAKKIKKNNIKKDAPIYPIKEKLFKTIIH